ncbi:ABC transporter substrate-binding protein [Candidatus Curculioniphilus buchneri]
MYDIIIEEISLIENSKHKWSAIVQNQGIAELTQHLQSIIHQ